MLITFFGYMQLIHMILQLSFLIETIANVIFNNKMLINLHIYDKIISKDINIISSDYK